MLEQAWERFEDKTQSRYDAVLFTAAKPPAAVRQISPRILYETAYTLQNLELHCVTNKNIGGVHTEDDRSNCGLVFSLGGIYRYQSGECFCTLEENRILYLPSHSRYTHTFLAPSRRDNPWQADMLVLNFRLLDSAGHQLIQAETPTMLPVAGEWYRQEFLELTEGFLSPGRQPSALIGKVYSLLSALTRDMVYENDHQQQFHALLPALDLLQKSPPGALRVEDLIAATYLSATRFRTLFREYAGIPPHAFLVQHTLKAAIPLLRGTDLTIPEISERLGFYSPSYFGKYIKKHTGQTPRDIRKKK